MKTKFWLKVLWALSFPECSSPGSCSRPREAGWCLGYICTCHLLLQHTISHQHLLCSQQAAPLPPEPWLPTGTTCLCAHNPGEWFCSSPWAISPARVHGGQGWQLWEHWDPAQLQASTSWEIQSAAATGNFLPGRPSGLGWPFSGREGTWIGCCSLSTALGALWPCNTKTILSSLPAWSPTGVVVQLQRSQFLVWESTAEQTTGCDTHLSCPTFFTTIYWPSFHSSFPSILYRQWTRTDGMLDRPFSDGIQQLLCSR